MTIANSMDNNLKSNVYIKSYLNTEAHARIVAYYIRKWNDKKAIVTNCK